MSTYSAEGGVILLGASGLMGKAFSGLLGENCLALGHNLVDLAHPEGLESKLDRMIGDRQVRALINCAAYTRVDQAESDEDLAALVNGKAPGVLAAWCRKRDIPLIHFSSDYVFSGTGSRPWFETDAPAPINAYGRSKAEGDRRIEEQGGRWLIFRPTWVYGGHGKSFFTAMLARAREQQVLRVVNDQFGAPTYAPQLGEAVLQGLDRALAMPEFPSGVYHLCHAGETTWFQFCCDILDAARQKGHVLAVQKLEPVSTVSFGAPARRPANSRLNTEKAHQVLGLSLPDWRVGFDACVKETL